MSPEQVRGEEALDARSDLYACGVVLYEMVTGAKPFTGENAFDIMRAQTEEAPQLPHSVDPALPQEIDNIVQLAIAKKPEQRFQSADTFQKAVARLRDSLDHRTVAVHSLTHRRAVIVVGAVGLLLMVGVRGSVRPATQREYCSATSQRHFCHPASRSAPRPLPAPLPTPLPTALPTPLSTPLPPRRPPRHSALHSAPHLPSSSPRPPRSTLHSTPYSTAPCRNRALPSLPHKRLSHRQKNRYLRLRSAIRRLVLHRITQTSVGRTLSQKSVVLSKRVNPFRRKGTPKTQLKNAAISGQPESIPVSIKE